VKTLRKVVLVSSGSSPDRAIALHRLLSVAADRSGWGPRLEIRLGGIDGGAGRITDAGLAALSAGGFDAHGAVCPDLERRPELLEGADVVVCDHGDVADVLVDWKESGDAEFVCLDELGTPRDEDGDENEIPIGDDVRDYEGKIEEVLRRVVAHT
jgi:hypothetical protein